jgi:hypothetical protein
MCMKISSISDKEATAEKITSKSFPEDAKAITCATISCLDSVWQNSV